MIKPQNLARRWQEVKHDVMSGMDVIHSNEKVHNGSFVHDVEKMLKTVSDRKHALLVRSGSEAITISLRAHGLTYTDEVLIPNYSCPATLSSVVLSGCVPTLCEIDQHGMMDTNLIDDRINGNTRAILATGLYGDVHDHDVIKQLCERHGLIYINDAAQSQFALHNGANSLTLGDVVCMSFADNKSIPVAGTYGAVLTDNDFIAERIRVLRKNGKPTRREQYQAAGHSSQPEEDKALQIMASFKHFAKWMKRRIEIGKIYDNEFAGRVKIRPSPSYSTWNGHKYAIMVDDKFQAYDKLLSKGVETEQHYPDNFSALGWVRNKLKTSPMTDLFVKQSLTIPNNPHMTEEEINTVIDSVLSL